MNAREARELLAGALMPRPGATWADFGAGEGTFTRALLDLLGQDARVYAVDRDPRALATIERWPAALRRRVITVVADLGHPFELPGLDGSLLDGALIANALHYFRDPATVLASIAARVAAGGQIVIAEYDRRAANPWVPYPIPLANLPDVVRHAGLSEPSVVATRPSRYGGDLYVATSTRLPSDADR
jgi:ubiquinone/menaquinone biosynthesis C-methylase UbiE